MFFWIGATLIALAVAAITAVRLIRRTARPAWLSATGFAVAALAAFGAAVQATQASLQTPPPPRSAPTASAHGQPGAGGDAQNFDALVSRLEDSLKANPDQPERWALLGRSYMSLGDVEAALRAFEEALDRTEPRDIALVGEYGEALVAAGNGKVVGEAEAAFAEVLTQDPSNPRARFYLAVARAEKGDYAGAKSDLEALLASAPEDAPWRATVFEQIQEIEAAMGREAPAPGRPPTAAAPPPERPPGPTAEDVRAAQEMSPDDRMAMIRGMVEGLAAKLDDNPGDLQGWLRLANAYRVLGEPAKAVGALEAALRILPNDPALLAQLGDAKVAAAGGIVEPDAEAIFRKAESIRPGAPIPLWRLGQAAKARGETEAARAMLVEALAKLPPDAPVRAMIQRDLDSL